MRKIIVGLVVLNLLVSGQILAQVQETKAEMLKERAADLKSNADEMEKLIAMHEQMKEEYPKEFRQDKVIGSSKRIHELNHDCNEIIQSASDLQVKLNKLSEWYSKRAEEVSQEPSY